jgi:hypothetical protein
MQSLSFVNAWRRNDPQLAGDALLLWERAGLLTPPIREQRAKELVALAYLDGKVAGVSTAVVQELPQLRGRFAFYRCAVKRPQRALGAAPHPVLCAVRTRAHRAGRLVARAP